MILIEEVGTLNHKNKIINTISKLSVLSDSEINLEDKFTDIGIDSLKIVELIIKLEEDLNIKFDDVELDPSKLIVVKNILELTEKYALARI